MFAVHRGFIEGSLRVHWGFGGINLIEPPLNPHLTPFEMSLCSEWMILKFSICPLGWQVYSEKKWFVVLIFLWYWAHETVYKVTKTCFVLKFIYTFNNLLFFSSTFYLLPTSNYFKPQTRNAELLKEYRWQTILTNWLEMWNELSSFVGKIKNR